MSNLMEMKLFVAGKKPGAKEQEVQINYGLQNSLLRVMSFMLLLVFT